MISHSKIKNHGPEDRTVILAVPLLNASAAFVYLKHDCTLKLSIVCSYMNADSNQMPVYRCQIMKRPGPTWSGGLDAGMSD